MLPRYSRKLVEAVLAGIGHRFRSVQWLQRFSGTPEMASAAGFTVAKVVKMFPLDRRTKQLDLMIDGPGFNFLPGQWVDFYIPEIDQVTGYSMISSPLDLPVVSLAVQLSDSPAASFVHEQLEENNKIFIRSGGEVTWDASSEPTTNVLLLAGGIGVTPFMSMVRHLAYVDSERKAFLLHSSRSSESLVTEALQVVAKSCPHNFRYRLRKTDGSGLNRISPADVEKALGFLTCREPCGEGELLSVAPYVCGPPKFVDYMESLLLTDFYFEKDQIKVERWW